jgi:hypothetical protein
MNGAMLFFFFCQAMLTFVDDRGGVVASHTCGDLQRKMQNLAALLLATPSQHAKG